MSKIAINNDVLRGSPFHTNTSKLVWFCLIRDVEEDCIVHTSALGIAKEIGVSEKTIRNVLKLFVDYGIIEIVSPILSPILSPNKVRYKGCTIKLNGIEICKDLKKTKVRKKSDMHSDIKSDIPTTENTILIPEEAKPKRGFVKPTIQEAQAYIDEKGFHWGTAETFIDFYESKGWKVGNQPMKNWKAAMRNWEHKWKEKYGNKTNTNITARQESRYSSIKRTAEAMLQQPCNLDSLLND